MFNPNDNPFGDDASFLAGLGIQVQEKKPEPKIEEKKPEPTEIIPQIEKVPEIQETGSQETFGNAKVIRRSETPPKTHTTTPHIKKKSSGDITFERSTYKAKEHKTNNTSIDDFIKQKSDAVKAERGGLFSDKKPQPNRKPTRGVPRKNPGNIDQSKLILGNNTRKGGKQIITQEKKEKVYKVSDSLKKKTSIILPDQITVKEFSEKMGVPLPEVMKVLLSNKIILPAQANIDFDTATLIAVEFDVTIEKEATVTDVKSILSGDLNAILAQDKDALDLCPRAPIVAVMGHVDHGKTRLLDYLRKTEVLASEAGGITQSIGASQIMHNNQKITFIDTPGHELFSSLRARGAKITNIAIIVVAADDGIKQQTIEAINHAKDAGVQIIVAITKADKGLQKIEEIKGQLAQQGLTPEDRGGETMLIPCSAITGQGIDDLLDAILLLTEMMELRYSPSRSGVATVLESHKDAKQGVLTTLLVMTGSISMTDVLVADTSYGKVRKMMNRKGESIKKAQGGDPIMILGLTDVVEPGKVIEVVVNEKAAKAKIEEIQSHELAHKKQSNMSSLLEQIQLGDKVQLKLILKADSFGGLEALKYASEKVLLPDTIALKIVHSDVGAISDGDIILAKAAGALIIGFNIHSGGTTKKRAEQLDVTIKEYDIIYEFIDFLTAFAQGLVVVEKEAVTIGNLEVLGVFYRKAKEMILGGKVLQGGIAKNGAFLRIFRGDEQIGSGQVTSLQRDQDSVSEVKEGYECGMKVRVSKKVELGDRLEFFVWQ